ncbi:UV DNA damage repair endonuclease UvsE [Sediminibacillus dalangtanensis]|uniref:UV DNA damage repair endonuclease UvsE n=1 Tax=Sediminibacillus dalangtanensis TaxID=2729421 RepID=A0ABX7VXQ7_9BACI|nr:UV DNA damage repair endonuclease UvsE [Sediminibacillus dalangtanensis]QTN01477.1 UV DNA damage repair endonuclease UvsE [Sediminibacillus dalangtanensis]
MTIFRLGYVAMSKQVTNSSPSQTMTFKTFSQLHDREAAKRKLERIARSNIHNCLRLLKHNKALDISFFRLSSRLIPLATHQELSDWRYYEALEEDLQQLGAYALANKMRIDFHPDHFVVLNSPKEEILKVSVKTLRYHHRLLSAMKIPVKHRCVLHTGGLYGDKEKALEKFIDNWSRMNEELQQMIMLENDDKTFTLKDVLYLSEKLGVPTVFDLHHHLANHIEADWFSDWPRILETWRTSELPVKIHLSSPKNEKNFRHHADYVDANMVVEFARKVSGTTGQIDCMLEAKQKDNALIQLVKDLKEFPQINWINKSTFILK